EVVGVAVVALHAVERAGARDGGVSDVVRVDAQLAVDQAQQAGDVEGVGAGAALDCREAVERQRAGAVGVGVARAADDGPGVGRVAAGQVVGSAAAGEGVDAGEASHVRGVAAVAARVVGGDGRADAGGAAAVAEGVAAAFAVEAG